MTWEGPEESFNIFRWYKSSWGRYTQADPIGLNGGTNLYSYVSGNPLRYADRLGLVGWDCRVGTAIKAGEIFGGAIITASCKSDCVNNRTMLVQLAGLAGGITVGAPVGVAFYDVRMNDPFAEPRASSLDGYFSIHALSASLIWGYTVQVDVRLGDAFGSASGWGVGGVSAGFDNFWGSTKVILESTLCCK